MDDEAMQQWLDDNEVVEGHAPVWVHGVECHPLRCTRAMGALVWMGSHDDDDMYVHVSRKEGGGGRTWRVSVKTSEGLPLSLGYGERLREAERQGERALDFLAARVR